MIVSHASVIKRAIRDARTADTPALERDVKESLREHCKDYKTACDAYERLRKHGEIYSYDTDDGCVVKVTEDYL